MKKDRESDFAGQPPKFVSRVQLFDVEVEHLLSHLSYKEMEKVPYVCNVEKT